MCSGETLHNHFKTNFALMQHHKYSLEALDGMVPWERDIYIILLEQYLEEKRLEQRQQNAEC